ncbi:transforming growth factor beta activator LRRC32 isoform X2 [Hypanus sabinus]|uniref:transforming growth factor beta activator LRRC32 isoform X2 n=1 Tax=Hypanus sabinus TaxID=79690 RepID=UPI0028C3E619|nr:transforming growth factor beta activator LRRC32 isoform X2 [Hypanus sabinus]XP_059819684.1 transforming growth factor beta activator LRRC32 isoform X2 [Hypanus sabinus]XP_059819685.1 transforming growth factor beta activator LRRC32 isoform X2 [Hypanus sabinus]XP_059819686.1 transforming growth factor beta activator LRRC32 isoform X2 [Hypanus sabinus]XP_059819688.1 transforming growth factor beta activator LRRC32 isoform X2 [Hypanus sabinus]XP_059819689.1 transforming growth factor beta act
MKQGYPEETRCSHRENARTLHRLPGAPRGSRSISCTLVLPINFKAQSKFVIKIESEARCQNKSLNAIPLDLPQDIWKLDLSVNHIQMLTLHNLTQYPSIQHLDLESNELEFIEPGSFASLLHLKELNLANNLLDLSKDGLGRLPHVERLDLSGNSLYTGVVEGFLKEAPSLEQVSLARNSITKLSDHTFQGNPLLKHINLQHNIIIKIESGAFQSLSNLVALDLAMNSIPCITEFDLKNLQVLNLSRNSIELFTMKEPGVEYQLRWLDLSDNNLPYFPTFPKKNHLRHLDLSRNCIQGFSLDAVSHRMNHLAERLDHNAKANQSWTTPTAHLSDLVYLDLSYNEITSIPWDLFRSMKSLRFLNLSKNCLQSFVVDEMNVLNSLVRLDLSSNALQNLLLSSRGFHHLKYLYLQDNYLQSLPSNIFSSLSSIQILSLQNNNISVCQGIPRYESPTDDCMFFSEITTLRYLYLHNNNIKYLPPHAFHQTPLSELDLSLNPGIHIHPEGFSGLEFPLTYLSLGGNGLSSLSMNLSHFNNLRTLDVSNNRLREFLVTTRNLSLEHVDLRNNTLDSLQETSMEVLNGTLRTLQLSGNPFNCCQATWVRWLAQVDVLDKCSVLCYYPTVNGHSQAHLFTAQPGLCQELPLDWTNWGILMLILVTALLGFATLLGCCLAHRQRVNKMFVHHVKA